MNDDRVAWLLEEFRSSWILGVAAMALVFCPACSGAGSRPGPGHRTAPDVVTTEIPSIRGRITQRTPERILIEEEPLDSAGSAKASVRLTRSTLVVRGSGEAVDPDELRTGQQVSAWFEGPVMESYPVQATAGAVRIETTDAGGNEMEIDGVIRYYELEGGFYGIRSEDGETYNPTNLPEEFRQDGLPVVAKVRLRHDMVSIQQAGALVEIVEIRKR
jgi:hypothetical protein